MEMLKAALTRNCLIAVRLTVSAAVAVASYLVYLLAFYGSSNGFVSHFVFSRAFMLSQYHRYDQANGATPLHWYLGYVVSVMGSLPSLLIAGLLAFSSVCRPRLILLSGVTTAFGLAMFVLYHRSQLHGHPEFIALAAVTTIGAFRCSGLMCLTPAWIENRVVIGMIVIAISLAFLFAFPLPTPHKTYMERLAKYDEPTLPALFRQPQTVRTIAMSIYPDSFFGTTDAWCRGEGNIFDVQHSAIFDKMFGNITCAMNYEPGGDFAKFNRVVFQKKSGATEEETEAYSRRTFHISLFG